MSNVCGSRGGWGGEVKVDVDRHMIGDTGGERIVEYDVWR